MAPTATSFRCDGRWRIAKSLSLLLLQLNAVASLSSAPAILRARPTSTRHAAPLHVLPYRMFAWEQPQSPITLGMQALHGGAALGAVVAPDTMDSLTASFWSSLQSIPFTHHFMFEACVAVGGFIVWVLFFESLHLFLPRAERYRLDGLRPLRPLHCFGPELHKSVVPAVTYLFSIFIWHQLGCASLFFDPVLGPKPDVFEVPTFVRVVSEVSIGVFLYDLLFYPFHMSFHSSRSAVWRRQHFRHHKWGATEREAHNAVETVQNSYLDAGIQVLINICVQQISPWGHKHPLSRMLHNLMVTYLLSESHSGYDLPFMSHRLFPALFGGPVRHELHHRLGGVYFHQFFKYMDDAFGRVPTAEQKALLATRASRDAPAAGTPEP